MHSVVAVSTRSTIYSDTEFLRWAREIFTALDVKNDSTAAFFDGKHAEAQNVEATCIRSSDAHSSNELGVQPTWVQMEQVTFAELRAALELPGRVSRHEVNTPASFIEGMHVSGAFLSDFWMTFSPNLNVLIGAKGSGKTSVLECLRFALGTEVPSGRAAEVTGHLAAILGPSGGVRVLATRPDGARVLIERSMSNKNYKVTFDDDRTELLSSPENFRFLASILGWHEIEHAATDRHIRRLHMDAIAGREQVKQLTQQAESQALAILERHEQAAAKYNEFMQLSRRVKQQQEMRAGLQQLKDANLIELRDQMARALADWQEIQRLAQHLESLPSAIPGRASAVLDLDRFSFSGDSPLSVTTREAQSLIADLREHADTFRADVSAVVADKSTTAAKLRVDAQASLTKFSDDYRERLSQFSPEMQRLLESHREVLEKTRELPNLEARQSILKVEIESALTDLIKTADHVAATLDERLELRRNKIAAFSKVMAEAGVQLEVVPGTARDDEFQTTFGAFAGAREPFDVIRSRHGGGGRRFHRNLATSYGRLRDDLVAGDHVVFSRVEFGRLITVLENDDLTIRFAVGKPGEPYSQIDQLSAGQRCTAVFPILLKLQDGPLIIDQPEDNLDNRHIAKSVATVLATDKRSRQIILTSHNANLVVLSDPESIVTFEIANGHGVIGCAGFLSHRKSSITSHVLDILDGGERALEFRNRKYGKLS
jgi:energy-coupling factor transporter ATP-binding protein EcfA2